MSKNLLHKKSYFFKDLQIEDPEPFVAKSNLNFLNKMYKAPLVSGTFGLHFLSKITILLREYWPTIVIIFIMFSRTSSSFLTLLKKKCSKSQIYKNKESPECFLRPRFWIVTRNITFLRFLQKQSDRKSRILKFVFLWFFSQTWSWFFCKKLEFFKKKMSKDLLKKIVQ